MTLYETIITTYPELTDADFDPAKGTILLRNDADKSGDYIAKWEFAKPIPTNCKLGK